MIRLRDEGWKEVKISAISEVDVHPQGPSRQVRRSGLDPRQSIGAPVGARRNPKCA